MKPPFEAEHSLAWPEDSAVLVPQGLTRALFIREKPAIVRAWTRSEAGRNWLRHTVGPQRHPARDPLARLVDLLLTIQKDR